MIFATEESETGRDGEFSYAGRRSVKRDLVSQQVSAYSGSSMVHQNDE